MSMAYRLLHKFVNGSSPLALGMVLNRSHEFVFVDSWNHNQPQKCCLVMLHQTSIPHLGIYQVWRSEIFSMSLGIVFVLDIFMCVRVYSYPVIWSYNPVDSIAHKHLQHLPASLSLYARALSGIQHMHCKHKIMLHSIFFINRSLSNRK